MVTIATEFAGALPYFACHCLPPCFFLVRQKLLRLVTVSVVWFAVR